MLNYLFFKGEVMSQHRTIIRNESNLKETLFRFGYSDRAAVELLKWYDLSKKGVASF
jgi:hypothetical protein